MNFTPHIPIIFISPSPHTYPPPLQLPPNREQRSHCGNHSVSHYVPQHTLLSTCLCLQMFIAMSPWSGARPQASATLSVLEPHWDSSWISFCCLVSWRSCSFEPVEPAPSCILSVHRWGCRDGPNPESGPDTGTTRISSHTLSRQRAGPALPLSLTHDTRASSTVLPRHDVEHGLLSQVLQQMRGWVSSHVPRLSEPALPNRSHEGLD